MEEDKYIVGCDFASRSSQTVISKIQDGRVLESQYFNNPILENEPFCSIHHNCMEDNKSHSKCIRVCEECQKVLLKQVEDGLQKSKKESTTFERDSKEE